MTTSTTAFSENQAFLPSVKTWLIHSNSKCGIAKTQSAYHDAVTNLFTNLGYIESHLESQSGPYYFGSTITEADIRLYVTIVRFDPVYVLLFKTNKGMIRF